MHSGAIYDATFEGAEQSAPEVSTSELRRILRDRSAIVIDTRTRVQFEAGHIPGARDLDVPPGVQAAAIMELVNGRRDLALVLYCNGPHCKASRRLAEELIASGFSNVKRYQLGMALWRALGGPTAIELAGIRRIIALDRTAVFIDARAADEFAHGSLPGARNLPLDLASSLPFEQLPLPDDDFNRRIVLFGRDAHQAQQLAQVLSARPWHNVSYFPGTLDALAALTSRA
jgi:rhodanese-related sulfurtransferase